MTTILRTGAISLALLVATQAAAQAPSEKMSPPVWPKPPVQLLILGTFHFKDAGLDSYKPKFDVDVLSKERQTEVQDVVDRLVAFRPNKIAVEWPPNRQGRLDTLYQSFRQGTFELRSNEIYQLAFRLASRLDHERLYAVDAERRFYEPWVNPGEYAEAHGQADRLDDDLWAIYEKQHEYDDWLKTTRSIRETLIDMNESKQLLLNHGQYVIGSFEVGEGDEYPGVDNQTAWYNRNLRIFANLQRIADMKGDRIMLLIGQGHVPIIRHAAQASPQFELVEVSRVLAP